MPDNQQVSHLRRIFSDIVRGFSSGTYSGKPVFIKHFCVFDQVELDEYNKECFNHAREIGVFTVDETLVRLKSKGLWTDADEVELAQKKSIISQMENTLSKLDLLGAIREVEKNIKEAKIAYNKKQEDKNNLLGMTCEKYASGKVNSFYIFKSYYQDKELNLPLFSTEEFNETDDEVISDLIQCYNRACEGLNTENVKKIALSAFFQNNFYLGDSIYEYWGKPLISLTLHQSELSSYGRYFKSILSNHQNIPDDIRGDPEKLVQFVEQGRNMDTMMGKEGIVSRVGATKEDLARQGLQFDESLAKAAREAKKAGKKLTALDIARIEGITDETHSKGQQIRTSR